MADPRFFQRSKSFTLEELANLTSSSLSHPEHADIRVEDVAPLDRAGQAHLSFLDNKKYVEQFAVTKAGACICHEAMREFAPKDLPLLISKNPYKSYALAAQAFYPSVKGNGEISDGAHVHPSAELAEGVTVKAGAVIEEGAKIGSGSIIESNAVIGRNVEIGQDCRIGANASITHTIIGDHVHIYPGARIGQDGFGFAIDPAGHVKVPQLGRVIIEDSVEIGANTCIDRGAGPDTVIGAGSWIDNLVQIGHNVKIGRGCIVIAQAGIAGSTELGDFVVLAAQGGLTGHLKIGTGARIAAQSGVMKDVPAGAEMMGSPAQPIKDHLKQVAFLKKAVKK